MTLCGAVVNGLAVIAGGAAGSAAKKGIPRQMGKTVMYGLGMLVIYIGISGALVGEQIIVAIISMTIGAIIGESLKLELRLNRLGDWVQSRFGGQDQEGSIAKGFVSCSLLVCVGAMAIVGSLESGISGNHSTLLAKSVIDGVAALVMGSSMGIGVALAGVLVMIYEGLITLFAQFLQPFLTAEVINEMSCVGSVLIAAVGMNMLGITKIKVINCVPAIFLPILFMRFL